jgi:hypothetical protein
MYMLIWHFSDNMDYCTLSHLAFLNWFSRYVIDLQILDFWNFWYQLYEKIYVIGFYYIFDIENFWEIPKKFRFLEFLVSVKWKNICDRILLCIWHRKFLGNTKKTHADSDNNNNQKALRAKHDCMLIFWIMSHQPFFSEVCMYTC